MMKKKWLLLAVVLVLCLNGCQSKEDQRRAEVMEAFENLGMEHDEFLRTMFAKSWKVVDEALVLEFKKEGTGAQGERTFVYSCGFDEDNEILLKIVMDDTKEEFCYFVTADRTGYGLYLKEASGGGSRYLLPKDLELLDSGDLRVKKIVGEWADASDNRYLFREDFTLSVTGKESKNEGNYSVIMKEEALILTLVFEGGSLEFLYEISEDGQCMELCAPGSDVIHIWTKK